MGKRKDSAALFEVFSGKKETAKSLHVPDWAKPAKPPGTPAPGQPTAPAPKPTVSAAPVRQAAAREPIALVVDGRLRLSLNYVTCAVACLGLLVLLGGAYKLGQLSGSRRASALPAAPSAGEPLSQRIRDREPDYAGMQARLDALPKGEVRLAVQTGVASEAEARAIQKYLWLNASMDTGLKKTGNTYEVWDLRSYQGRRPEEIQTLADSLKTLGARPDWQYRDKYGLRQPTGPPENYNWRNR